MQEKFLPDSSLTSKNKLESTMLREFLQKTTHNFKSFREEFDFLNDGIYFNKLLFSSLILWLN